MSHTLPYIICENHLHLNFMGLKFGVQVRRNMIHIQMFLCSLKVAPAIDEYLVLVCIVSLPEIFGTIIFNHFS